MITEEEFIAKKYKSRGFKSFIDREEGARCGI
jgi:hypothetical protein